MRHFLKQLAIPAATCGVFSVGLPVLAQTPTYAPSSPLIAPGEPLSSPVPSTVPESTVPQSTIPSTTPGSTIPYSIPGGNPVDPPATVVTPGTVSPMVQPWGAWYPGYWLGFRRNDPPYGGGSVPYRTNYQGYGLPPAGLGGCNTCQPMAPCGQQNLDFGRGYDGFMTGW